MSCCRTRLLVILSVLLVARGSGTVRLRHHGGADDTGMRRKHDIMLSQKKIGEGRRLTTELSGSPLLLRRSSVQYSSRAVAPLLVAVTSLLKRPAFRNHLRVGAWRHPLGDDRDKVGAWPFPQGPVLANAKPIVSTLLRVAVPTLLTMVVAFLCLDDLALSINRRLDESTLGILQADASQYIQNFHVTNSALFNFLASAAYISFYDQQQRIYEKLFEEVAEAKALLEQTTLVLQGRSFYPAALASLSDYVKKDLRQLSISSATMLTVRQEDPLESIMYMTSVGEPSMVYDTVKELREKRSERLGAMQRKFPGLGIALLYVLALNSVSTFPLLAAGTADSPGVLSLHSYLFAIECGVHMLVLQTIQELWRSSGGVYNVDGVLEQMVTGLEEDLEQRSKNAQRVQRAMLPRSQKTADPKEQ